MIAPGQGWSDCAKACGRFFVEAGVEGGCKGTCFDLVARQVDKITTSDYIDEREPLVGLAMCAVWVMETLAHHSAMPTTWITKINAINGLVSCAAYDAVGLHNRRTGETNVPVTTVSVQKQVTRMLYTLAAVYDTLWQHMPGGFITCQLEHRYPPAVRKAMKRDFKAHLDKLLAAVAHEVTEIAEIVACLSLHAPTANEKLGLGRLLETAEMAQDAIGHKVRSYKRRDAATKPNTISFTRIEATLPRQKEARGSSKRAGEPITPKRAASARGLVSQTDTEDVGPAMTIALADGGSSPVDGTTFTASHHTKPKWTDEIVVLPLPAAGAEGKTTGAILPLTLTMTVRRGDNLVGAATVELREPLGRIDTALLNSQGAVIGSVGMLYQAPVE